MQLGRLGAWYSTDKLGGPTGDRGASPPRWNGLATARCGIRNRAASNRSRLPGSCWRTPRSSSIGSSIASIYARDAFTSRRGMLSLNALYGDRFILGLGVSHLPMVEGVRGHTYGKPMPVMRAYLDGICKGQTGCRGLADRRRRAWAADVEACGEKTRGAVPYNVTPEHTARAAKILGPGKWLAVEQKVCLETDRGEGAGAGAGRTVALHGAGQLSQLLAAASALPRRNWQMAGPTGSSMRWCCGAMRRR